MAPQDGPDTTLIDTCYADQPFEHGDTKGSLRCVMKIMSYANFESARRLEMKIQLRPEGQNVYQFVGDMIAWFIRKSHNDANGNPAWIKELLNPQETDFDSEELRSMMKTLYTSTGQVQGGLNDHSEELSTMRLIFVDSFELAAQWQGKRIGPRIMSMFFEIMKGIFPEGDSNLVSVLCPARGSETDLGNEYTDVEVERKLQAQYERSGYRTWLQSEDDAADSVTVMGRSF